MIGVADGGLIVALANGETQLIATDEATRFVREQDADPTSLVIGTQVRVQSPRGGFGQGGETDPAAGPVIANRPTSTGG